MVSDNRKKRFNKHQKDTQRRQVEQTDHLTWIIHSMMGGSQSKLEEAKKVSFSSVDKLQNTSIEVPPQRKPNIVEKSERNKYLCFFTIPVGQLWWWNFDYLIGMVESLKKPMREICGQRNHRVLFRFQDSSHLIVSIIRRHFYRTIEVLYLLAHTSKLEEL